MLHKLFWEDIRALHLGGIPSLKIGTRPPSCLLLDNRLYMSPDFHMKYFCYDSWKPVAQNYVLK